MLGYNLKIALKSLRRNPVLTALLIGAIALGICVSTSFVTLRHLFTQDPLPGKSDQVFYVQLDSWGRNEPYDEDDPTVLPDQITYRDARNLMNSKIPLRQTPTFITRSFVHPDPKMARPFQADIRLAFSDFFQIFNIPFRYGGPWT
ncbi:MAG: ABC transporter permease, partial [Thermoanaerobaculia bacterium]